jgi:cellulose synthase (UDP-forming)
VNRRSFAAPDTAEITVLPQLAQVVVFAAAVAGLAYFPWRLTTFNPHAMVLSFVLYAAELFGVVTVALHAFMTWRVLARVAPPPEPGLAVDIFIPTYNEPVEMLRRTLLAARDMTYPHETWLLDDGNRLEMARLASELGVRYLARPDNDHAKAGNLNYALARSSGQFIAIFDADHVPHRDYLLKTLGYFRDERVAFVQTPQDFYNLDSFQHRKVGGRGIIWTEQSLFFRVIMPGKDYWNACFFCGSCATARRSALLDIGGFATETVTEDLHTSLRLHKKGYASVYHPESLAFGVAPGSFGPYESQRVRWGQGAMQVWRKEGVLTARGLTLAQRLCYFASVVTYFDGWQKLFMYLLPSFVLVTGIVPLASLDWHFAALFLPWWLLSFWACEELGRGYARPWMIEQYNFLRFPGFVLATLTLLFDYRPTFKVTQKDGGGGNRRHMAPHLAVIAIAVAAVAVGVVRFAVRPHMQETAFILNIVWIAVVSTIAVMATRFAFSRSNQGRASYRFRLPVPMAIRWPGQATAIVATDDVSSGGFRLVQHAGTPLVPGTEGDADLILPSGRVRVPIRVQRSAASDRGLDSALSFLWSSAAAADALDGYLYGSNNEWLFNGLREHAPTPMDRFSRLLGLHTPQSFRPEDGWRTVVVLPDGLSRSLVGLARIDAASRASALVLPAPVASSRITLIVAEAVSHVAGYRIVGMEAEHIDAANVYVHKLVPRSLDEEEFVEWAQPESESVVEVVA